MNPEHARLIGDRLKQGDRTAGQLCEETRLTLEEVYSALVPMESRGRAQVKTHWDKSGLPPLRVWSRLG